MTIFGYSFSQKRLITLVIFLALFSFGILYNFLPLIGSNDSTWDGPGDQLALSWVYDQSNETPVLGKTDMSNYPNGENLWNPFAVNNRLWYPVYWLQSKILGSSIAGYNMIVTTGLFLSQLLALLFALRFLTKNIYIANIGAYFTVFTPYMINKSSGHLTFMFAIAFLCAAMWLTINLYNNRRLRNVVALGLLVGSTFYFDLYFVLMIPVIIILTWLALFARSIAHSNFRDKSVPLTRNITSFALQHGVRFIYATIVTLLIMLPGLLYLKTNSSDINNFVSSTRPNIKADATSFSMRAKDYILPSPENPLYPTFLTDLRLKTMHGSNPGEVVGFLGYSALLLFLAGGVLLVWRYGPKELLLGNDRKKQTYVFMLWITVMGIYFSLPPDYKLPGGLRIITPADLITNTVGGWRVFARFHYLVQIGFIFATLQAWYILFTDKGYKPRFLTYLRTSSIARYSLFILLFVILVLEYGVRAPFNTLVWDRSDTVPKSYYYLKDDPAVTAVAEYPQRLMLPYSEAYQPIHGKKLFSPVGPESKDWLYKNALVDIDNPQTPAFLYYIGVNRVNVFWNTNPANSPGLSPKATGSLNISKQFTSLPDTTRYTTVVYDVLHPTEQFYYLARLDTTYLRGAGKNQVNDIVYGLDEPIKVELISLCNKKQEWKLVNLDCSNFSQNSAETLRFKAQATQDPKDPKDEVGMMVVHQEGNVLWQGVVGVKPIAISVPLTSMSDIVFTSTGGKVVGISDVNIKSGQ